MNRSSSKIFATILALVITCFSAAELNVCEPAENGVPELTWEKLEELFSEQEVQSAFNYFKKELPKYQDKHDRQVSEAISEGKIKTHQDYYKYSVELNRSISQMPYNYVEILEGYILKQQLLEARNSKNKEAQEKAQGKICEFWKTYYYQC